MGNKKARTRSGCEAPGWGDWASGHCDEWRSPRGSERRDGTGLWTAWVGGHLGEVLLGEGPGQVGEAELSTGTASAPLRSGRRASVGTGQEESGPARFPAHLLFLAFPFGAQLCPFVPRRCWCGHLAISVVFIPKFLVQTPMVTWVREPPRTCLRKIEKLLAHEAEKSRLWLSLDTSGSRNRSDFIENLSLSGSQPFFPVFLRWLWGSRGRSPRAR